MSDLPRQTIISNLALSRFLNRGAKRMRAAVTVPTPTDSLMRGMMHLYAHETSRFARMKRWVWSLLATSLLITPYYLWANNMDAPPHLMPPPPPPIIESTGMHVMGSAAAAPGMAAPADIGMTAATTFPPVPSQNALTHYQTAAFLLKPVQVTGMNTGESASSQIDDLISLLYTQPAGKPFNRQKLADALSQRQSGSALYAWFSRDAAPHSSGKVSLTDATAVRTRLMHLTHTLLQANRPALLEIAAGLKLPFIMSAPASLNTALPYGTIRTDFRLLELKSAWEAEEGQWAKAAGTALDMVRMGRQMREPPMLIGYLISDAEQVNGANMLWEYVGHLTPQQARKLADALQTLQPGPNTLDNALQGECSTSTRMLAHLLSHRYHLNPVKMYDTVHQTAQYSGWKSLPPDAWLNLFFHSKQYIIDRYQHIYQQQIADVTSPRFPPYQLPSHGMESACGGLFSFLSPLLDTMRFTTARWQLSFAMLQTRLALKVWHAAAGSYPPSLHSLVPNYLPSMPHDPFDLLPTGKLHYRRTRTGYILYSVGPDHIDQHGAVLRPGHSTMGRWSTLALVRHPNDAAVSGDYGESSTGDVVYQKKTER